MAAANTQQKIVASLGLVLVVAVIVFWQLRQPPAADSGVRIFSPSNALAQQTSAVATAKHDLARKLEPSRRAIFGPPKQIRIDTRIIEFTNRQPAIEWIGKPTDTDTNGTIVWVLAPEQFVAFEKRLGQWTDAQTVTSPRAITLDGERARIEVSETKVLNIGNGQTTNATFGISLALTPSMIDEDKLSVTAIPDVTDFLGYEGTGDDIRPIIRERKAAVSAVLTGGQGMIIGGTIPGTVTIGTRSIATNSGGVLIIVKPTIVDSKGNQIFPKPQGNPQVK
jgi:hypothetical protein